MTDQIDGLCSPVAAQFMRQRHRAGRCTRVSAPKLAWLIPRVSGSSMGPAGRSRRSIIGVWLPAGSVRAKESPIRRPRRARSCTFLAVVPRTEPRLVVRRDRGSWKRINGSPAARRGPLPAVIQTLEPLAWRLALGGGGLTKSSGPIQAARPASRISRIICSAGISLPPKNPNSSPATSRMFFANLPSGG